MESFLQRLESSDLQEFVRCLEEIQNEKIVVDDLLVTRVGLKLKNATSLRSVPMSLAENVLFAVGKIMEGDEMSFIDKFAANSTFIDAMAMIILDFNARLSPAAMKAGSPFASHYCYELCVYIVVGMVETSALLKIFLKVIPVETLRSVFYALCSIIPQDFLFITQEMALEIVCRISHFYLRTEISFFQALKQYVPKVILQALESPSIGATGILRDMRPFLLQINQSNPRIVSEEMMRCTLSLHSGNAAATEHDIETTGWMDAGTECFCITVGKDGDKVVRLKYAEVVKMEAKAADCCLMVWLEAAPNYLVEYLHENYQVVTSGQTIPAAVLSCQFSSPAVLNKMQNTLNLRVGEAMELNEANVKKHTKASQVSSRILSAISSPQDALVIAIPEPVNATTATTSAVAASKGVITPTNTSAAQKVGGEGGAFDFVSPTSTKATKTTGAASSTTTERDRGADSPSSISSPDMTPQEYTHREQLPFGGRNLSTLLTSSNAKSSSKPLPEGSKAPIGAKKSRKTSIWMKKHTRYMPKPSPPSKRKETRGREDVKTLKKASDMVAQGRAKPPSSNPSTVASNNSRRTAGMDSMLAVISEGYQQKAGTVDLVATAKRRLEMAEIASGRRSASVSADRESPLISGKASSSHGGSTDPPAETPQKRRKTKEDVVPDTYAELEGEQRAEDETAAAAAAATTGYKGSKRKFGDVLDQNVLAGEAALAAAEAKSAAALSASDAKKQALDNPSRKLFLTREQAAAAASLKAASANKLVRRADSPAAVMSPAKALNTKGRAPKASELQEHMLAQMKAKELQQKKEKARETHMSPELRMEEFLETSSLAAASAASVAGAVGSKRKYGQKIVKAEEMMRPPATGAVTVRSRPASTGTAAAGESQFSIFHDDDYADVAALDPFKKVSPAKEVSPVVATKAAITTTAPAGAEKHQRKANMTYSETVPPVPTTGAAALAQQREKVKDLGKENPSPATVGSAGVAATLKPVSTGAAASATARKPLKPIEEKVRSSSNIIKGTNAATSGAADVTKPKPIPLATTAAKKDQPPSALPQSRSAGQSSSMTSSSKMTAAAVGTTTAAAPSAKPPKAVAAVASAGMTEVKRPHRPDQPKGMGAVAGKQEGGYEDAQENDWEDEGGNGDGQPDETEGEESHLAPPELMQRHPKKGQLRAAPPAAAPAAASPLRNTWRGARRNVASGVGAGGIAAKQTISAASVSSSYRPQPLSSKPVDTVGASAAPLRAAAALRPESRGGYSSGGGVSSHHGGGTVASHHLTYTDDSGVTEARHQHQTEDQSESPTHHDVSDNGSSEEDHIISILLREIVQMQKDRASRKRARLLQNHTSAVTAQILTYLGQCRDFAEASSISAVHSITEKFNTVCLSADVVCDALSRDVDLCVAAEKELKEGVKQWENEVQLFQQDVAGVTSQYAKDEREIKAELMQMKSAALEEVKKKSLHHSGGEGTSTGGGGGGGSGKLKSKELLKALREL